MATVNTYIATFATLYSYVLNIPTVGGLKGSIRLATRNDPFTKKLSTLFIALQSIPMRILIKVY